jgi:hypothetical protein
VSRTAHKMRGFTGERACGKWCYRKRADAEAMRQYAAREQGEVMSVYGCTGCGGFHLTSSRVPRRKQVKR